MANNPKARIHREAKSPMQSGKARAGRWVLEFEGADRVVHDPLTGWNGSADTRRQLRLAFATEAEATAYAEANAFAYEVEQPRERSLKLQAYADNFR